MISLKIESKPKFIYLCFYFNSSYFIMDDRDENIHQRGN